MHRDLWKVAPGLRLFLLTALSLILLVLAVQSLSAIGTTVSAVLIPLLVSILLASLMMPLQLVLNRRLGINRHVAAGLNLVITFGGLGLLLYFAGAQLAGGVADLRDAVLKGIGDLRAWVVDSSLPVTEETIQSLLDRASEWLQDSQGTLVQGAVNVGSSAANLLFGFVLVLFGTFFILAQGDKLWSWIVTALPGRFRSRWYEASRRAWVTTSTYVRMQVLVAGVDAIGIALGAWILGLPFVIPVLVLSFVLCIIPVVGAFVSGAVVVLIALAFEGLGAAIIMLLIVLAVQQLEGDVLSPLLMGKAVKVHPLVVLFAVAGGTFALGFLGALFAVPVVAGVSTVHKYISGRDPFPVLDQGGSALSDPAGKLVGDIVEVKLPAHIGDATPTWLIAARHASEEGLKSPLPGHLLLAAKEFERDALIPEPETPPTAEGNTDVEHDDRSRRGNE